MTEAKAVSPSPQVRDEILDLLHREAELLDEGRLDEWLDLLTDDVTYQMPVRMTRERGQTGDARLRRSRGGRFRRRGRGRLLGRLVGAERVAGEVVTGVGKGAGARSTADGVEQAPAALALIPRHIP